MAPTRPRYIENIYLKYILSAARKLRELGIDEIVQDAERSKLGKHMAKRLVVGFDPLNKRREMLLSGKSEQVLEVSMDAIHEAATDDKIGSSMSPVNANQTQDTRGTKSKKAMT